MRYIYYIIIIILVLSAFIGYEIKSKTSLKGDIALVINDRVISTDEFNKLYKSSHIKDKNEFINSLITKELLIQESQKENIDKEESFRLSIQNFYEQSLIKLLIDRKLSSLNITVDDEELNRYILFLDKKLHLTIFNFNNLDEAIKNIYKDSGEKIISFEELSDEIKDHIMLINEGEITGPIKINEEYIRIRLDKIESVSSGKDLSEIEINKIKELLKSRKKEKIINDWINDLREKASIKILLKDAR